CEHHEGGRSSLPDTFQTSSLLFYERFKAYQDYMLEQLHLFCMILFQVTDLDLKNLKAWVELSLPLKCVTRGCEITEEAMLSLLEATQYKVHLQELQVVYDESGDFVQTALALEHLRFFYKHIWREWDEEDEDDDFDYFVRCVEPRLRLFYDILEDRVPVGLVAEYRSLLENCSKCFQQFSQLRSSLSVDSDSELDNVSMVEGLKLYDQLETFKRKLRIIENPLLRYVLAYKGNSWQQNLQSRGLRSSGLKVVHVVTESCCTVLLQSLLSARLMPLCSTEDTEIQFHREPVSAVDACHQDDVVILLPGRYSVSSSIFIPDSITMEGFGFPDEIVIEKKTKGSTFVESTGADVRLSNIKFIQHDAIEGILCVRKGTLNMENCVLQCQTTGVIVQTSARLTMNVCDLYGSKGAGVEIYPGSVCSLVGNSIHHCRDGILIKDFANALDGMPAITMENNNIHNNEGYAVILVKPGDGKYQVLAERREGRQNFLCVNTTKQTLDLMSPFTEDRPGAESKGDIPSTDMSTSSSAPATPKSAETNSMEEDLASAVNRKWQFSRQISRNKEVSCSRPVQDLMEHQIFVSVQGNQFRRNGKGDFGTFFY
uniref:SHC SH2-domain binding protein 1 n=1 Tax=Nothobranchius furzeri TaxID=105023 RepID=A0A8C6PCP4_NOTFU